ncbi:MAG: hypothetical protein JO340_17070 [Acidobacteriaceae bacterium]|nr:hypothetical protein [Acidobacteriaceae bacterium]
MNGDHEQLERRFLFHAEALGLGAHFRRPKDFYLDSVASSVLAITGGRAEARAERGGAGVISYESAFTRVTGDYISTATEEPVNFTWGNHGENNLPTLTTVGANVRGFAIDMPQEGEGAAPGFKRRTVEIGEMDCLLESTSDRREPNAFRSLVFSTRGVRIDGRELFVKVNTELFNEKQTKKALDCAMKHEEFRRANARQIIYDSPTLTLATVVTGLEFAGEPPAHTEIRGNQVKILGVGSLYFGELVIEEGFRRFSSLRFQLGSPDGGEGTAGQGQSNGTPYPPQGG